MDTLVDILLCLGAMTVVASIVTSVVVLNALNVVALQITGLYLGIHNADFQLANMRGCTTKMEPPVPFYSYLNQFEYSRAVQF